MLSVLSLLLILMYGAIIIYFTLLADGMGRIEGYSEYRYNVTPFNEIRRFIIYRHGLSLRAVIINLIGNIFVFSPMGFLIPIWSARKNRWYHAIIYTFTFSFCIEIIQLFTKVGVFDVDDLIMNTLGGYLGWLMYFIIKIIFRRNGRKQLS